MEEFLGKKYVMVSQENLDDYFKFIGYGYIFRKMASTLKPAHMLTKNEDGTYTFLFEAGIIKGSITFKLGEEFEETLPGRDKGRSVITFEGNKMIHKQTNERGLTSIHVREYFEDKMISTTTVEGLDKTVTRVYERC